jgi:hypothetical protein
MSDEHTQDQDSVSGNAPQQYPLAQAFEAYDRRYRNLRDIEFGNSSRRMELRHRLDNLRQHLGRLQDSIELLVDEPSANATDSNASPRKPRARRKKLRSDVRLDLQASLDQVQALDELTEELREYDRKQEDAERSFDNAVQTMSTKLRQRKLIPENETALEVSLAPTITSMSEHHSETSPPIAAELAAYYDAIGMLKVMAERVGELQVEQQEQWERRGVMEDQGQVLDQSEDEFLRSWNDTLDVAYKDFTAAQADVEKARQNCDAMSIAIPAWADVDSVGEKADEPSDDAPDQGMVSPPNSIPGNSQPVPRILQPPLHRGLPLVTEETLLHDRGSPLATPPHNPVAKDRVARWIANTDPVLDPQPLDFPQGTPIAVSEDLTPAAEQQHSSLPPKEHQWSNEAPLSARSDSAAASTSLYMADFDVATGASQAKSWC